MHVHLCWKQEHLWPRTCFCTGCSQSYGLEASAKYTHPARHHPIPPLAGLLLQFHTDDCMLTKDQSHIWFSGTEEIAKTEKLSTNITDKITNNATLAVLVPKQFFSIPLVHSWCCCHFISEGEYFANVSFNSKHSWWGGVGSRAANVSTSTLVFLVLRSDTKLGQPSCQHPGPTGDSYPSSHEWNQWAQAALVTALSEADVTTGPRCPVGKAPHCWLGGCPPHCGTGCTHRHTFT